MPADGETHQGIYDAAFLSQIGLPVCSPCNYQELRHWLRKLVMELQGPLAPSDIPGAGRTTALKDLGCSGKPWDLLTREPCGKVALVTYGALAAEALTACAQLKEEGIACDLFKLVQIYPLDEGLLQKLSGL